MSTNQKNTASEKKDAVVPASDSEAAPSNARFLGACGSIGFLPLLEPSLAKETRTVGSDIFGQAGSSKDCLGAFPQPQEESLKEESHKKDDMFDANGGLKNYPGAFPVDEPEDSVEAPKAENQVGRKELDRYKGKQE
ncbi:Hypothetical protein NCS54_01398100 [Fusarium falciforme]|uniref:Hypothetical protein n=1 Tax=Fusarium falciforme TaxID=195108 RepID=UPI0023002D6C|nr:Hypothetical protein NCS54_01398100 [Fusarium falciforme]WAO96312.1 Hypothetical protein NCS54_01398100 [Fusarium falciforme]